MTTVSLWFSLTGGLKRTPDRGTIRRPHHLRGSLPSQIRGEARQDHPHLRGRQKEIKFNGRKRQGDEYRIPLALQLEAGITWALQADGAFALELPIAGVVKQAVVQGSCHVLRSAVGYVAAFSGEEQDQAFESTTGSTVKNAYEGMRRFLEADILYGQDDEGIGVVEKKAGEAATAPATGNVPANTIQITPKSWASGLWVEGAKCEVFAPDHTAIRNAAAPAIVSVDIDNRFVTFDTIPAATVDGDVVHYKTQHTADGGGGAWKTMAGLKKIITNTGTLFGINAGTYNKWKGNVLSASNGPLTFPLIGRVAGRIVAKGGQGNKFILWTAPDNWSDLNTDIDAMRRDDAKYMPGKIELGHESITYYTVAGPVEIRAHACVKEGEAIMIPVGSYDRIGSTDITFDRSKMTGLKAPESAFLRELENNAGFEFRTFDHQAVITERPGYSGFIKDIVKTAA